SAELHWRCGSRGRGLRRRGRGFNGVEFHALTLRLFLVSTEGLSISACAILRVTNGPATCLAPGIATYHSDLPPFGEGTRKATPELPLMVSSTFPSATLYSNMPSVIYSVPPRHVWLAPVCLRVSAGSSGENCAGVPRLTRIDLSMLLSLIREDLAVHRRQDSNLHYLFRERTPARPY